MDKIATLNKGIEEKSRELPCAISYEDFQRIMQDIICGELDLIAGRSEQFSYIFDKQNFKIKKSPFYESSDKRFVLIWRSSKAKSINEILALIDDRKGQSLLEMHLRNNFAGIFKWLPRTNWY